MVRWLVGSVLALTLVLGGFSTFTGTAAAGESDAGASLVKGGGHKGGKHKGKHKKGKHKGKHKRGKKMTEASA